MATGGGWGECTSCHIHALTGGSGAQFVIWIHGKGVSNSPIYSPYAKSISVRLTDFVLVIQSALHCEAPSLPTAVPRSGNSWPVMNDCQQSLKFRAEITWIGHVLSGLPSKGLHKDPTMCTSLAVELLGGSRFIASRCFKTASSTAAPLNPQRRTLFLGRTQCFPLEA